MQSCLALTPPFDNVPDNNPAGLHGGLLFDGFFSCGKQQLVKSALVSVQLGCLVPQELADTIKNKQGPKW